MVERRFREASLDKNLTTFGGPEIDGPVMP
jgi:hypothetical protein